jgi:hypothetical protein
MMQINQPNENDFDALLKAGLRNHAVNVPPDFAQKLLTRIQRQEYADALRAIKIKERLLLAAMILMPAALAAVALLMPHQAVVELNHLMGVARQEVSAGFSGIAPPLRNLIIMAFVAGLLVYGLFESLRAEN